MRYVLTDGLARRVSVSLKGIDSEPFTMHICVIGSGVIGVTAAYALAHAGHTISLLDSQPEPGRMTSAANGGQLSYSYVAPLAGPGVLGSMPLWLLKPGSPLQFRPRLDPHQWRWLMAFIALCNAKASARTTAEMLTLSSLSRNTLHHWLQQHAWQFDLRRTGKLIVHRDQAGLESARKQVQYQAQYGSDQQVLSRDQVVALEPALAPIARQLTGAVYTPSEETADCYAFTQAVYGTLLGQNGVQGLMGTHVNKLIHEQGRIVAAQTNQGDLQADAYVVANGMGSRALLSPLGVRAPIYGLKGYSLSIPLQGQTQAGPSISVTDYQRRIVYARLGDTLRAAAMVDIGDETTDIRRHRIDSLRHQVQDTLPGLNLDGAQAWAGLRPATPASKPIIGAAPMARNLWLNIGHGALGFTLACGSAALLASLINGQPAAIDARPFAPT